VLNTESRRHKGTEKLRENFVTLRVAVPQPALTKEGWSKKTDLTNL